MQKTAFLLNAALAFIPAALADDARVSPEQSVEWLSASPPAPLEPGALPSPLALAASWDRGLVREAYAAMAASLREQGVRAVAAPSLALMRDPRRGRPERTFGEDPYLVGELGVAAIEGLQFPGGPVLAAATDFAGPPLPRDGAGTSPMAERELRTAYLAPFAKAIERAHLSAIVASRNELGGIPSHANAWLMKDVLREQMHFTGVVVADPDGVADLAGIYRVAANAKDAARLAASSGVDVIPASRPVAVRAEMPDDLARRATLRSIVLLKNDGVLPVAGSARAKVAVIESGHALANSLRDRVDVVAPDDADIVIIANERANADAAAAGHARALIIAWGTGPRESEALFAVITGRESPSGKLPVTIARSAGQLPAYHDAKPSARRGYLFEGVDPLFPFGSGLTYTTFELGAPRVSRETIGADATLEVSVDVRNTGAREGDETVQLYVRAKTSPVTRARQQLAGFERVHLAPGESRTVTLAFAAKDLAAWDMEMRHVVAPGEYEVMTGPDSAHLQAAPFTIGGTR